MYRLFRSKRGDISLFENALKIQAFKKEPTCMFGYIIKSIFVKENLGRDNYLSEFESYLTKKEFEKALEQGCNLWKRIYYIFDILNSEKKVSDALKNQFTNANNFLIDKLK